MKVSVIKDDIKHLSIQEKRELIEYIKRSYSIFDEHSIMTVCPECSSKGIVKNGKRKGVQKYVCKDCGKNFNYRTNTVLSRIQHLNKWNEFVEEYLVLNVISIKKIKDELGISEQTAFNWRHKLFANIYAKTESRFSYEPVELDEAFFRLSWKGKNMNMTKAEKYRHNRKRKSQVGDTNFNSKVFFAYGRNSHHLDVYSSHTGRTTIKDMENYFLPSKFNNTTVYCDSHNVYRMFFERNGIPHELFKTKDHLQWGGDREVHVQHVNAHTNNFKSLVNEYFKGVSTRYLPFYLAWHQFIVESKTKIDKMNTLKFNLTNNICNNVVQDKFGFELYRQSEVSFVRFLKNNEQENLAECKNHYYADKIAA